MSGNGEEEPGPAVKEFVMYSSMALCSGQTWSTGATWVGWYTGAGLWHSHGVCEEVGRLPWPC